MLVLGCARQNNPTGGDKDTVPPQVLKYEPSNLKTGFDASEISIEFDEYIQVKSLNEQLIVSPPLEKNPEYTLRGKSLILFWEEELLENTTYQFNFGNAVSDITESNANRDLVYVFSTGSFIDSLVIGGKVLNASDNAPVEGAAVMLYRETADSLPLTTKPDFFGLTNESGDFTVRYLPEGKFKLFILSEEAPNYLYGGAPEKIGFLKSPIASQQNDTLLEPIILPIFTEEDTLQFIANTESRDYGYYRTVFNLPAKEPNIQFHDVQANREITALSLLSEGRDTLTSWIPFDDESPLPEEIRVITNDDTSLVDTAFWYPEVDPQFREDPQLEITSNLGRKKLNPEEDIRLIFSNPINEVDSSLILLFQDSVPTETYTINRSVSGLQLIVEIEKDRESRYELIVDKGAVKDIYGVFNDSTSFGFQIEDEEYYGNLTISVNDSLIKEKPNPIYELLNEKNQVLKLGRPDQQGRIYFEQLAPGKYGFRITFDANENGEWDTGNYQKSLQPEERIIYNEPIEVRSNWDLEIEWLPVPVGYDVNRER